jgi:exportin-1
MDPISPYLINMLEQEWLHDWPSFISESVLSYHNISINVPSRKVVLRISSEDVLNFLQDPMISTKAKICRLQRMCRFVGFQLNLELLNVVLKLE